MPQAFKLFFTEETARPIRKIWDVLADSGLATFMKDSGSTPGATLGVFENGAEREIMKLAEGFGLFRASGSKVLHHRTR